MRSKDCRHYSRRELIEIIYELERREEKLEKRLERVKAKLKDRTIKAQSAGTLADVAAVITGLFTAADETAALYLSALKVQAENAADAEERAS